MEICEKLIALKILYVTFSIKLLNVRISEDLIFFEVILKTTIRNHRS